MGKWGRFTGVSEQVPSTAPLGSAFLLHNYVLGEFSQTGIINLAPWVNCGYPYAPWHYTHNFVHVGMYLVVPWLSLIAPDAGGLGLIPCQGTRSHKPQIRVCMSRLKIAHATLKTEDPPAAKTQCSQVNFFFFCTCRILERVLNNGCQTSMHRIPSKATESYLPVSPKKDLRITAWVSPPKFLGI